MSEFAVVRVAVPPAPAGSRAEVEIPRVSAFTDEVMVIGVMMTFTADANAANRAPYVQMVDPEGRIIMVSPAEPSVLASETWYLSWRPGIAGLSRAGGGENRSSISIGMVVARIGDVIHLGAMNQQAGDVISGLVELVEFPGGGIPVFGGGGIAGDGGGGGG